MNVFYEVSLCIVINRAENEAAVTIQAGYRGYKARRENKESAVKDEPLSDCVSALHLGFLF